MQMGKNQEIEALVERIVENKVAFLVEKAVEDYVRRNEEKVREFSLLERIVRVEEELKALREVQLSMLREMNVRFESIEKRFSFLQWFIGIGFTFLAFLITLLNFMR